MKQKLLNLYFNIFAYFARKYIKKYNPIVIGITGSVGKTSCRMVVYDVLKNHINDKIVYTSNKNFNGELGMSLSILGISDYKPRLKSILNTIFKSFCLAYLGKKQYDVIILEYGIDHVGEMDFLLSIVKPDISVITKIDKVHSQQFKSKEITASEKYKLAINTKQISFLNLDDDFYSLYENNIKCKKIYYSTNYEINNDKLNIYGKNYTLDLQENLPISKFDLYLNNENIFNVSCNLIGTENIGYINIGFMVLDNVYSNQIGFNPSPALPFKKAREDNVEFNSKSFLEENKGKTFEIKFELQPGRFSIFNGINNSILVDGTYNGAPLSMKKFIDNVLFLKENLYKNYKLIFCLGEMRELGDYTQIEHEDLVEYIDDKVKNIYLVGDSMKKYFLPKIGENLEKYEEIKHFTNSKILGEYLKNKINKSAEKFLILFKGSQNTIFLEESVKEVLIDKNDENKLCRQEKYWMENKNKFFQKANF